MFERFTDRARQTMELAQQEAWELGHDHVGTEHILLGLLHQDGLADQVLREFGVTVEDVRPHVSARKGRRAETVSGRLPFTPGSKKALELALREALSMGHNYIGVEHILLGLARLEDGTGLLTAHGATYDRVRESVETMLAASGGRRVRARAVRRPDSVDSRVLALLAAFGIGIVVGKAIAAH